MQIETKRVRSGWEVALTVPTIEQFLENLYRMKRDSLSFMRDAAARGDLREAEEFAEYVERIESMIEQRGGDPDSLASVEGPA